MAGLDQHWPPAVAQQYPHSLCLLHSGGQSPPTECIVLCVCVWVGGRSEGQSEKRKGRGERRRVGEGEGEWKR